jgi:hypothetical protein
MRVTPFFAPRPAHCGTYTERKRARAESRAGARLIGRRPLDASDTAVGVGDERAFRLIQDHQYVAKGIAHTRAPPDRNVERRLDCLASSAQEKVEGFVDIVNDYIGFGADIQVNYELGVRVRKSKPNRFRASPQDSVPEAIAIKPYRRIKIGDAKQEIVQLSK